MQRKSDEGHRVQKMIEHRLVPDLEHPALLQRGLQSVRAECAQTHREKTKNRRDAEKSSGHDLFPAEKFPERLNDAAPQRAGFLARELQLLPALPLGRAAGVAKRLRPP